MLVVFNVVVVRWPSMVERDPNNDHYYELKEADGDESTPATPVS